MRTFEHVSTWLTARKAMKAEGQTLGFVPTMGALHEGHLSLVAKAKAENDKVMVSIFVNPTQFNNKEDLEKYPRTLSEDLSMLADHGVDFTFIPAYQELYPDNYRFKVIENEESKILCGAFRPGHFDGVLTVMMKLLHIAKAERCYMGEKDFQQFRLVQDMTKAFFMDTEIIPCPVVREESGLAMSSRNRRLSDAGRAKAALIHKILSSSASGEEARGELSAAGFNVEYCEEKWNRRLIAAEIEGVRLIDNVQI